MRVNDPELRELALRELVDLGEFALEHARAQACDHVDQGCVEELLHGFTSFRIPRML